VLADALVITALFPLLWWSLGRSGGTGSAVGLVRRLAASLAGLGAMLLPFLFRLPGPLAMSFSLPEYIDRRLALVTGLASGRSLSHSADTLATSLLVDGLGLAFVALLLLPMALQIVLRLLGATSTVAPTGRPLIVAALGASLLVQVLLALRTVGNSGYGHDWQFLLPLGVVLAVWCAGHFGAGLLNHRLGRPAWAVALVVVGLTHAFGPMLASARGPDPIDEQRSWEHSFWEPWHHSHSGSTQFAYGSHLMVTLKPHGAEVLARTAAAGGHGAIDLSDLFWKTGEATGWSCSPPEASSPAWERHVPVSEGRAAVPDWPFFLNGASGVVVGEAEAQPTLVLMRLGPTWSDSETPPPGLCDEQAWLTDDAAWAHAAIALRFPGPARVEELWNPGGTVYGDKSRCWKPECPPSRTFLVERVP